MTDVLEYQPDSPRGVMILLHGLGASGRDMYDLAPQLAGGQLRVLCPDAPIRPVTINHGWKMRAWYDIVGPNLEDRQDDHGIHQSTAYVQSLIEAEICRGFAAQTIFIGGFSQGAAIALQVGRQQQTPLAGMVILSGYMLQADATSASLQTPVFQAHGNADPIVLPAWARRCRDTLTDAGYALTYREYNAAHHIAAGEVNDLNLWLHSHLSEET